MDINIIPLVKNKCGDLTDMNNYRAIALSNVETKMLEKDHSYESCYSQ